jgi:hypothetical protein
VFTVVVFGAAGRSSRSTDGLESLGVLGIFIGGFVVFAGGETGAGGGGGVGAALTVELVVESVVAVCTVPCGVRTTPAHLWFRYVI